MYVADPFGVNDTTPEFSWIFSDENSEYTHNMQKAYRIIVSTSQTNLSQNMGDMWDSGKNTSITENVLYAGSSLE